MGIRAKFFLALLGIAGLEGGLAHHLISSGHDDLIKQEADRIANIVTTQVLADRAVYSAGLVGKLKKDGVGTARDSADKPGFIMLPAQIVRQVSQKVADGGSGLYSYRLVSEWNLNAEQGIETEFDS